MDSQLTSANDNLSISAKSIPDLRCEIDLSRLVVCRCLRGSKDTPQTSAVGCVQSCDHCRLIRRIFQSAGDRKEGEELTNASSKITQLCLYTMFPCQPPDRIVFVVSLNPLSPDLDGLEGTVCLRGRRSRRGVNMIRGSKRTTLQTSSDFVVSLDDKEIRNPVRFEFLSGGDSGDTCSED